MCVVSSVCPDVWVIYSAKVVILRMNQRHPQCAEQGHTPHGGTAVIPIIPYENRRVYGLYGKAVFKG